MRFVFIFAALIGPLFNIPSTSGAAVEIPFTYADGMIWMKVNVVGQHEPLNFLLDSGAEASVFDLQVAHNLGLKFGSREVVQGVQGRCVSFHVSGIDAQVATIPIARLMLALDLSPISRGCGKRIDGLVGADFFHGRIVQIDYAAQKIRLLQRSEIASASAEMVPLARRNGALCVRVGVNGNAPQWMRLDTGCSSALELVAGRTATAKAARTSIAAATGSRQSVQADVKLGSEQFAMIKIGLHDEPMFAGEAGLLGNGLLSQFRVTVDVEKSRLILSRIH